jgi:hypothetical protein
MTRRGDEDDIDDDEAEVKDEEDTTMGDLLDDTTFDPKDILGKILAFVNQVRSSPQARTYFRKLCVEENVKPLQLLKWVRTRWASLYDLISRLIEVRPVRISLLFINHCSHNHRHVLSSHYSPIAHHKSLSLRRIRPTACSNWTTKNGHY